MTTISDVSSPLAPGLPRVRVEVRIPGSAGAPVALRSVTMVNADASPPIGGVLDGALIVAAHVRCDSVVEADRLWQQRESDLVGVVRDGRSEVVERMLALTAAGHVAGLPKGLASRVRVAHEQFVCLRSGAGVPLFDRASLLTLINDWIGRTSAICRLEELGAGAGLVRVLRAEDAPQFWAPPPDRSHWRHWLTEDDKALFKQAAGTLLDELGYVRGLAW